MSENKLRKNRAVAIRQAINLGLTLKEGHPEIADLRRNGHTLLQIVDILQVESNHNVFRKTAVESVCYACAGHNGSFGIDPYDGQIPNSRERNEIKNDSLSRLIAEGRGIFGRTLDQKSDDSRKGVEAKGEKIISDDERTDAYKLSKQRAYQWPKGGNKGDPIMKKIAQELKNKGYSERTPGAIATILQTYRKDLKK